MPNLPNASVHDRTAAETLSDTASGATSIDAVVTALAAFPRALAAANLPVGPDRTASFLTAAHRLAVTDPAQVYWAGRATLTSSAGDIEVYDRVFHAYFGGRTARPGRRRPAGQVPSTTLTTLVDDGAPGTPSTDRDQDRVPPVRAQAAALEMLRHKDMAHLTGAERIELNRMLTLLRPGLPTRRSARHRPARTGAIDARRTVRAMLAAGGDLDRPARRRRRQRPRRIVLLIDISGSMAPYADSLLRFAHVLVRARPAATEVFTIGTRLSRVSRALRSADPEVALAAAADVIPDYSGGTRLGEMLRTFLDQWGQRGTARGAAVVIFSDGWERGDATLLASQAARLRRLARILVWVNPHKGKTGYLPVQTGIRAVLPHIDRLLAGHSLATLEELLEEIRSA